MEAEKNTTSKKQVKLDGLFEPVKGPVEYSQENVLHSVAQFIACDDQVRFRKKPALTRMC
jgi:hypothetical protein